MERFSIIMLLMCIISVIVGFILISRILHAITRKDAPAVRQLCNKFTLVIIWGGGTLSIYTVLDAIKEIPHISLLLIALKILGSMGPFFIGGGVAVHMFRKAAKNLEEN